MSKKRNIVGNKYGKLTVIAEAGQSEDRHFLSLVRCECGNEFITKDTLLIKGRISHCIQCKTSACKTHGMSKDRLFFIWQSMKARCNNPNKSVYKHYGGRGIRVCDEWNTSFENFRDWAFSNGYSETLSIDRIDVNGNYEPSNCRWTTMLEQARNRRDNVMLDYEGQLTPITKVAELTGIDAHTIYARIHNGWNDYEATHTPIMSAKDVLLTQRCMRHKKVLMIDEKSSEKKLFVSLSDASRFLGYGCGYLTVLSRRLNTTEFHKNGYHIIIDAEYSTENMYEKHSSR